MNFRPAISILAFTAALLGASSASGQILPSVDGTANVDAVVDGAVDGTANVDLSGTDTTDANADVNLNVLDSGSQPTSTDANVDINIGDDANAAVDVNSTGEAGNANADIRVGQGDASGLDSSTTLSLFGSGGENASADIALGDLTLFDVTDVADPASMAAALAENDGSIESLRSLVAQNRALADVLTDNGVSPNSVVAIQRNGGGSMSVFFARSTGSSTAGTACSSGQLIVGADDIRAVANATAASISKLTVCPGKSIDSGSDKVAQLRAVVDANSAIESAVLNAGYGVDDVIGARMASPESVTLFVD